MESGIESEKEVHFNSRSCWLENVVGLIEVPNFVEHPTKTLNCVTINEEISLVGSKGVLTSASSGWEPGNPNGVNAYVISVYHYNGQDIRQASDIHLHTSMAFKANNIDEAAELVMSQDHRLRNLSHYQNRIFRFPGVLPLRLKLMNWWFGKKYGCHQDRHMWYSYENSKDEVVKKCIKDAGHAMRCVYHNIDILKKQGFTAAYPREYT